MIDKLIFILMIVTAIYIVSSRNLKRIIVALSALSLLAAFCYLIYHAPDVAVAEAVIGSALSTILFIVALKKHRTFYVYFSSKSENKQSDFKVRAGMEEVASKVMDYCSENDLEAQSVFTHENPKDIADEHLYDLILEKEGEKIIVYGSNVESHVVAIKGMLAKNFNKDKIELKTFDNVEFYSVDGEEIS